MKAYGLPRDYDATNPNSADGRLYGRATRATRLDGRASQRSAAKRAARRRLARGARAESKRIIAAQAAE